MTTTADRTPLEAAALAYREAHDRDHGSTETLEALNALLDAALAPKEPTP